MALQDTYSNTTKKLRSSDTPWYWRVWYVWVILALGIGTAILVWHYRRRIDALNAAAYEHRFEKLRHTQLSKAAELNLVAAHHKELADTHKQAAAALDAEIDQVTAVYEGLKDRITAAATWKELEDIDADMD